MQLEHELMQANDTIRQKDETIREKEEAIRENYRVMGQKDERIARLTEELMQHKEREDLERLRREEHPVYRPNVQYQPQNGRQNTGVTWGPADDRAARAREMEENDLAYSIMLQNEFDQELQNEDRAGYVPMKYMAVNAAKFSRQC